MNGTKRRRDEETRDEEARNVETMNAERRTQNAARRMGFTVIEMILSMVLVSLTIFGTASIIISGLNSYAMARERRAIVHAGRYGLDRMAREMRQITTPATFILIANGTTFRYATQLVPLQFVTFQLSNSQLTRDGNLLVNNVTAGGFTYYNTAGLPAVGIADIARVGLDFTVNTGVGSYSTVRLQTDVYLRNRHYVGFRQL